MTTSLQQLTTGKSKTPQMQYREFTSLEEYREFYTDIFNAKSGNKVYMPVPTDAHRDVWMHVHICHPDRDYRLISDVLEDPRFTNLKWRIAPVALSAKRKEETVRRSKRIRLRTQLVNEYRRDMVAGSFFPLLAFDEKRNYWLAGRHRSTAAEGVYGALYAVVFEDLTEKEELIVVDVTNRWHSEHWDIDEQLMLAHSYMKVFGWSQRQALAHFGLSPDDADGLIGAELLERHQNAEELIRTSVGGEGGHGGRPRSLKTLGQVVSLFGRDSIDRFTVGDWEYVFKDTSGALSKLRDGNHPDYKLKGEDARKKYSSFRKIASKEVITKTTKKVGVIGANDKQRWVSFVRMVANMTDDELLNVRMALDDDLLSESRDLIERLNDAFFD